MDRKDQIEELKLYRNLAILKSKKSFWEFCKTLAPDFYKEDRPHLVTLCNTLQALYEGRIIRFDLDQPWIIVKDVSILSKKYLVCKRLQINMPPQHGKSRTLVNFADWVFGIDKLEKIITCSYNDSTASDFSRYVRDGIMAEKNNEMDICYSDIFPNTKIKNGNSAFEKWALAGTHFSYLGAGIGGSITGKGANCFPKGTLVKTEIGDIEISLLVSLKKPPLVLSYDHKRNILVYRKIITSRRLYSNEFTQIKTRSGKYIECTNEHLIYNDKRGYRKASLFREGDGLKTCNIEKQQNMQGLWKTKNRSGYDVSIMLSESESTLCSSTLRLLPQRVQKTILSISKVIRYGLHRRLLLKKMQPSAPCNKEQTKMYSMWETSTQKNYEVLFSTMQEGKLQKQIIKNKMSYMWDRISTQVKSNSILFTGVRQQSALSSNGRKKQFSFQRWEELYKMVSRNASYNYGKRQLQVCGVQLNETIKNTSCERRCDKQHSRKPLNTLPSMPYITSSLESDTVSEVRSFSKESVEVYDIQVEETSNFFANEILVHNCLIVDDPIKGAEEAYNKNLLDKIWRWYTGTFLSRVSAPGGEPMEIVNMTRWSKDDICGRIMAGPESADWYTLTFKAYNEATKQMLCPELLSYKRYCSQQLNMDSAIFEANYNQKPIDIEGCLYQNLKEYDKLPVDEKGNSLFESLISYTDTADTGNDNLVSIVCGVIKGELYLLDIYYTKDAMEITEPGTADFLYKNLIGSYSITAKIESNNGGRGFARNVDKLIWERHKTRRINISWFHQGENKIARILTNASYIINHMYFPQGWNYKFPEAYKDIICYQKTGKNIHDDIEDTLTGAAEMINSGATGWMDFLKDAQAEIDNREEVKRVIPITRERRIG